MSSELVAYQHPVERLRAYVDERAAIEDSRKRREAEIRRESKSEMSALRGRFVSDAAELCADASGERVALIAAALYWFVDVPVGWIADAVGKQPRFVTEAASANPVSAGKACVVCGFQETAGSRETRDMMNNLTGYRWTHGHWAHGICESCWPKCCYCHKPVGEGNPSEWYVDAIERGTDVYHASCAPKEPAEKTRREQYADYLRSDHWRSVREWALERAGRRCQVCNTDERQLHVHHRTYERVGAELPEDLIVLCDGCHDIFHKQGKLT